MGQSNYANRVIDPTGEFEEIGEGKIINAVGNEKSEKNSNKAYNVKKCFPSPIFSAKNRYSWTWKHNSKFILGSIVLKLELL